MEFEIEVEGLDAMAEALGARLEDVLPAAMRGRGQSGESRRAKDARKLVTCPQIPANCRSKIRATDRRRSRATPWKQRSLANSGLFPLRRIWEPDR